MISRVLIFQKSHLPINIRESQAQNKMNNVLTHTNVESAMKKQQHKSR